MTGEATTPDPPSDVALLRRWLHDRDAAAFAEFECLYRTRINRWAWGRLSGYPDREEAIKDVVQETLLALARAPARIVEREQSLDGLIYRVADRKALDWIKSRGSSKRRATATSLTASQDVAAVPAETPAFDELAKLRQCLDRLPDQERQVVGARFFAGLDYKDLGFSNTGTAYRRVALALEALRRCMESTVAPGGIGGGSP